MCVYANELAIVTGSECLKSNLRLTVDKFICTNWYNKRQPAKGGNVRKGSGINTQIKREKGAEKNIYFHTCALSACRTHACVFVLLLLVFLAVYIASMQWQMHHYIPATLSKCSTYFVTHSFQFHFVTIKSLILSNLHRRMHMHMYIYKCAFTCIYIWIFKLHIHAIFG